MAFIIDDILIKILMAPVAGPVNLGMKLLETIRDELDRELFPDEAQIRNKLVELGTLLEAGQISEAAYDAQETLWIEKWRAIQESKGAQ
ncbi:MAG: gas vesicle protein GvpG [Dehalococcoidia bacterium]|nr:gas vesicle protein GvpG [Dehalococcoidia bacterium]